MTSSASRIVGVEDRQRVLVESSLYEEFSLEGIEDQVLSEFFFGSGTVDAFVMNANVYPLSTSPNRTEARPRRRLNHLSGG